MNIPRAGSITRALTSSLLVGLTLLWLLGVLGSGLVLKRLVDARYDEELQESAAIMMSLINYSDDLLMTAAILGDTRPAQPSGAPGEGFAYVIRDATGRVLLQSAKVPAELTRVPLQVGLTTSGDWRVVTRADTNMKRFLQLAEPLDERTRTLVTSLAWLTVPLAVLLAFAAFIVLRASRSLVYQVQMTAVAVSRQDPQALGMLPLDGVVTEMKPAVEATNRLIGRLADALESERSFTYNSAHELRTPIAGALAQAQVLAAGADGTEFKVRAEALVGSLARLARLAERLLALARAEGNEPLADEWVDLGQVVRLTADEFQHSPRLGRRRIATAIAPARVRADLDAVGLALRNLVENAIAHGSGATVIRIVCETAGKTTSLAVIDDGRGVLDTDVATLVKRFARGPGAASGGAGLGLSIVDTLARRMGAQLVLTSPLAGQARGFEARLVWPAGQPRSPG